MKFLYKSPDTQYQYSLIVVDLFYVQNSFEYIVVIV